MRLLMTTLLLVAAIIIIGASALATAPSLVNFQGRLVSSLGLPIDTTVSMTFTIYDSESGGVSIWAETQTAVNVTTGAFNVLLGSTSSLTDTVFLDSVRWLGVAIGTDPEMTPRTRLASSPYSYRVATVDGASGGTIGGDVAISQGNLNLDLSSSTSGVIFKEGTRFIHDYGSDNTFIGFESGNLTMSGAENTASGARALSSNTSGDGNTASGTYALYSNTTGDENTANGTYALFRNTSGGGNTANGTYALLDNTIGGGNTASGYYALLTNTSGGANTANGAFALMSNTSGHDNTAIGREALLSNTFGGSNTASGVFALGSNTNGNFNTASGSNALALNTTGEFNTASGTIALFENTTGSYNTAIGYAADATSGALTNATAIGANAKVDASDKIRLGDGAVTVIEGQVAYTFISDKNAKENFHPVDGDEVLRKLSGMTLTSWNYKGNDPQQFRHYGPVAQEFFEAFGHDGVGTSGTPTTINSGDEAGILMIAVQALSKRNQELESQLKNLTKRLERVEGTTNSK